MKVKFKLYKNGCLMDAAMFLFLQLEVHLNVLSNIYQTEFDQSPAQACAIDLPELNYGL